MAVLSLATLVQLKLISPSLYYKRVHRQLPLDDSSATYAGPVSNESIQNAISEEFSSCKDCKVDTVNPQSMKVDRTINDQEVKVMEISWAENEQHKWRVTATNKDLCCPTEPYKTHIPKVFALIEFVPEGFEKLSSFLKDRVSDVVAEVDKVYSVATFDSVTELITESIQQANLGLTVDFMPFMPEQETRTFQLIDSESSAVVCNGLFVVGKAGWLTFELRNSLSLNRLFMPNLQREVSVDGPIKKLLSEMPDLVKARTMTLDDFEKLLNDQLAVVCPGFGLKRADGSQKQKSVSANVEKTDGEGQGECGVVGFSFLLLEIDLTDLKLLHLSIQGSLSLEKDFATTAPPLPEEVLGLLTELNDDALVVSKGISSGVAGEQELTPEQIDQTIKEVFTSDLTVEAIPEEQKEGLKMVGKYKYQSSKVIRITIYQVETDYRVVLQQMAENETGEELKGAQKREVLELTIPIKNGFALTEILKKKLLSFQQKALGRRKGN